MTPDFCLVTAVTPDYLPLLRWSAPSWAVKPQFAGRPLLVFHHGFDKMMHKLGFLSKIFPAVVGVPWAMPQAADDRERMISAFILGVEHIQSEYFVKLDADMFFTTAEDVFTEEHFKYDLVAQRWNYTKPGWWVDRLEAWSRGEELPVDRPDGERPARRRAPRIISYCCLHKTEFVRKAAELAGNRLPVPSHDSYLWWLAENCKDFSWLAIDQKGRGVKHTGHRWKKIREQLCASEGIWNPTHNDMLLSHIQLEITTACNLACPNCDRACGVAPSKEHMTLADVQRFADESKALGKTWKRIDILGGEPTLHPDLLAIFDICRPLAKEIRLTSNGTSDKVKAVLATVPAWVKVRNSSNEKQAPHFAAYNLAPVDQGCEDANACSIPWRCGVALSPHGYYLCGAGAGVDRVFGLHGGIRSLRELDIDHLRAQQRQLCRLCGHSTSTVKHTTVQETSPSWEKAIAEYKAGR